LTIKATSGSVTVTFSTAVTSTAGYILTAGTVESSLHLKVPSAVYVCSNSTTAKFQAIAWDN
jgi:urease alpha subunit